MLRVDMKWMERKYILKEIYKNPDKYFTEEVMQKLDDIAKENIHMVKIYDNIIPDHVCQKINRIYLKQMTTSTFY